MLLNQIVVLLTALAASASAQGFTVAENTPDGDYSVSYDAAGVASFLKLQNVEPLTKRQDGPIAVPRRHLEARGDEIGCGNRDNELNHGDTDAANSALDAKCGGTGELMSQAVPTSLPSVEVPSPSSVTGEEAMVAMLALAAGLLAKSPTGAVCTRLAGYRAPRTRLAMATSGLLIVSVTRITLVPTTQESCKVATTYCLSATLSSRSLRY